MEKVAEFDPSIFINEVKDNSEIPPTSQVSLGSPLLIPLESNCEAVAGDAVLTSASAGVNFWGDRNCFEEFLNAKDDFSPA